MHRSKVTVAVVGALLVGACYTVAPRPAALDEARFALDAARGNPQVTALAPEELNDAVALYHKAEATLRSHGDTPEVRHLASFAIYRAAIAQETASQRSAQLAMAAANAEHERERLAARTAEADAAALAAQLAEARAEGTRRAELSRQDTRSAQEQARAADLRSAGPESQLRDLAATRSARGLVVTMNDVLFDPGSDTLRPGGVRLWDPLESTCRHASLSIL